MARQLLAVSLAATAHGFAFKPAGTVSLKPAASCHAPTQWAGCSSRLNVPSMQMKSYEAQAMDFEQFLAMQSPQIRREYSDAEIKAWFDAADSNGSGKIDANEFLALKTARRPTTYEEYMRNRDAQFGVAAPTNMPPQPRSIPQGAFPIPQAAPTVTDTDPNYERVPWWKQDTSFSEAQRKDRRTIFMHDDWVRHRSSERFLRNMMSIGSSGINQALAKELSFVTLVAAFVVVSNMLLYNYQDFGGVVHPGPLNFLDTNIKSLSLPALPFSIAMPALSLLLVFRTNTAYFRWNEARTLWGGLINNCRNVVRQSNGFFPNDAYHNKLKKRLASETAAFIRSLRNFLRGPTDDETLKTELYEQVVAGHMTRELADAAMAAKNRPMFMLAAMSATLRKADIDTMHSSRIDSTISTLVDLTGANERVFKSPIPLVYTRLTARFLTVFLVLLPFALWGQLGESWNHWATIPVTFGVSFFLFGIEEVGIQIEEPFSILPLEAFCNGAIEACQQEMLAAEDAEVFESGL